jgi:hypothetical protein
VVSSASRPGTGVLPLQAVITQHISINPSVRFIGSSSGQHVSSV